MTPGPRCIEGRSCPAPPGTRVRAAGRPKLHGVKARLRSSVAAARSAENDVVNLGDLWLSRVGAELVHDRHERLAELLEGLLGVPHVENLDAAVPPREGEVIRASGGRARAGPLESLQHLVVALLAGRLGLEVEDECHRGPPLRAIDACDSTSNPLPAR